MQIAVIKRWTIAVALACLPALTLMGHSLAEEPAKPGKKINKWVDDKGMTHYGDVIPSQYSNKNSVINSQGMVIQRNDPKTYKAELTPEEIEMARRDRALLASFTTEQEIDLARDRHLQMDDITIQGLQQRRQTAVKQLETNQKFAAGFLQRKKPVPPDVSQDIKDNQAEIGRIDAQIKQQNDTIAATRKRFDNDKKRFIELKSGTK